MPSDAEVTLRTWGALKAGVSIAPVPNDIDTAEKTAAAFRDGADAIALLRTLEWAGKCRGEQACCPSCEAMATGAERQPGDDEPGIHHASCELARLIGARQ